MNRILILLAGLGVAACAPLGDSSLPIATELRRAPQPSAARTVVIVLPGRADDGLGENERGMARAIHEPGPLPAEVDAGHCQRQVWKHIREQRALGSRVWLACGSDDLSGARLLATTLPEGRFVEMPGGHDWRTWSRIGRTAFSQIRTQEPDTL